MTDTTYGPFRKQEHGLVVIGPPPKKEDEQAAELELASALLRDIHREHRRAPWYAGDLFNLMQERYPETWSQMVEPGVWETATLERYGRVCKAIPEGPEREYIDDVDFSIYQSAQTLQKDDRTQLVAEVFQEGLTVSEARQRIRLKKSKPVSETEANLFGRYRVVLARPDLSDVDVDELLELPIEAHTRKNAALFLLLDEKRRDSARAILERWGFEHRAAFIWDMVNHQRAHAYLSERHQHLIWAVRGKCPPDELVPMRDSVQVWQSSGEFPNAFRELIESLYTRGPYLELFATTKEARDGWTKYGRSIGAEPRLVEKHA